MPSREFTHVYVMVGFFLLVIGGLGAYFIWQPELDGWLKKHGAPLASANSSVDPYVALLDAASRKVDDDPDDPVAYHKRAELHHRFGYLEKALADYDAAIDLGADTGAAYFGRAGALQSLGRPRAAVEDLRRGIERSPFDEGAIWNLARLRQALGQWEVSVEELTGALDMSETSLLYHELAWAQWGTGDYEGALASFDRTIELGRNGLHSFMSRGYTRGYLGEFAEAEADLEHAVALGQQGIDYAHFALWIARARQGERGRADDGLAAFADQYEAVMLGPWPVMIAEFLLGRLDEAELLAAAEVGQYLGPEAQVCEAYYYAGIVRLLDGDADTAMTYFRKCVDTKVRNYYEYYAAMAELRTLGALE